LPDRPGSGVPGICPTARRKVVVGSFQDHCRRPIKLISIRPNGSCAAAVQTLNSSVVPLAGICRGIRGRSVQPHPLASTCSSLPVQIARIDRLGRDSSRAA
jgi:hypothetical protein